MGILKSVLKALVAPQGNSSVGNGKYPVWRVKFHKSGHPEMSGSLNISSRKYPNSSSRLKRADLETEMKRDSYYRSFANGYIIIETKLIEYE